MSRSAAGPGGRGKSLQKKERGRPRETRKSRAARERIMPMQNLRARVRTRGVTAPFRWRGVLSAGRAVDVPVGGGAGGARQKLTKKRKGAAAGDPEIAGGARTDNADAKFESESPHQRGYGALSMAGGVVGGPRGRCPGRRRGRGGAAKAYKKKKGGGRGRPGNRGRRANG